ncbi:hypothetical protein LMG23994_07208 [Cupriavidus pinatubonensis]|uniref:Uncharacterized protein n=1 Tax=Cupriavidus pinatubonensis TaxID=248026 RepID=A0ABM8Y4Y0_9BURK|nr:hypothetical protein LMG23994_07208 [Cupriavidus pinatubonensis]
MHVLIIIITDIGAQQRSDLQGIMTGSTASLTRRPIEFEFPYSNPNRPKIRLNSGW